MQLQVDFTKPIARRENNPESQQILQENNVKFTNQCKVVYEALCKGERLTTATALVKYGVGDLRRRIKDLKDNYNIKNIKDVRCDGGFKQWFIEA